MRYPLIITALLSLQPFTQLKSQTQFWLDNFETSAPSSGTRTPSWTGSSGGPPATRYFMRTTAAGINKQTVHQKIIVTR